MVTRSLTDQELLQAVWENPDTDDIQQVLAERLEIRLREVETLTEKVRYMRKLAYALGDEGAGS